MSGSSPLRAAAPAVRCLRLSDLRRSSWTRLVLVFTLLAAFACSRQNTPPSETQNHSTQDAVHETGTQVEKAKK